MKLETVKNNSSTYTLIRNGVQGNLDTALQMANLVNDTVSYDLGFNQDIKSFFAAQGFNPYNNDNEILEKVVAFIKRQVKYIPDKAGKIESISDARQTLKQGFGDCDDLTVLAASIVGVLGFENVNFVLASYKKQETFDHIYLEVIGKNNERFVIDATLPDAKLNDELKPVNTYVVPVFHQDIKQKVAGAVIAVKNGTKRLVNDSLNTIPYAIQFMPLGLVSANLLQHGISLISDADLSQMSLSALGKEITSELDLLAAKVINQQIADVKAKTLAMQIAAQLGTYHPNANEQQDFIHIKNIIKEKVKYIYYLVEVTPEINLNAKGMVLTGAIIIGVISYAIYKNKGRF